MNSKQTHKPNIFIPLIILAGVLLGLSSLIRPKTSLASVGNEEFSAERALEHVSEISQVPHPPGSREIERVRQYIVEELRGLGLEPEVQNTSIAVSRGSSVEATAIQNIIVKIPGTNPSKAILLDAHYDTRAMTPGASDCGSCVATVLETARAVLAGPPLKNDLILLFTDNEEYGAGLGAAAFVDQHPLANEIGLVLNFEGLGSAGPSILFESGPASGWAVKEFGKASSRPLGQSWFYEVYRMTPIGTDLNRFSDAGISGLNFGYWARGYVYHSRLDNPDTIDPRSLHHQGSNALSLVQQLGNSDLDTIGSTKGDAVYFSLVPGIMISYPAIWSLPLAILAGGILAAIFVLGKRRKRLTGKGVLTGLGGFFLSLVGSAGLATGIWMGLNQLHSQYLAMFTFRGMFYNGVWYFWAFSALAAVISSAVLIWLRKKTTILDLFFGSVVFFWIMALATSILFPGLSYLFSWPLIFSGLALGWVILKNPATSSSEKELLILTVGSFPGLVIIAPSLYVMYHFALAPMIGILPFMVALVLGLLIPFLDEITSKHTWRFSTTAAMACVVLLAAGSLSAGFNAEKPRPNAAAYMQDTDSKQAVWFSAGYLQDTWTRQFFVEDPELVGVGELFPLERSSGFPVRFGPAPYVDLVPPSLEILSDSTANGVRRLEMNLNSPRGAEIILLDVEPYQAVIAADLADKRIETPESGRDLWSLTYYAVPKEGIYLVLELDPDQDIKLQLSDQGWDLPLSVLEHLDEEYQPRLEDMMPMPNFDYGTVVSRIYDLK